MPGYTQRVAWQNDQPDGPTRKRLHLDGICKSPGWIALVQQSGPGKKIFLHDCIESLGLLIIDLADASATSSKPFRHSATFLRRPVPKQTPGGRFRTGKGNELGSGSARSRSPHLDTPTPDRPRLLSPLFF